MDVRNEDKGWWGRAVDADLSHRNGCEFEKWCGYVLILYGHFELESSFLAFSVGAANEEVNITRNMVQGTSDLDERRLGAM